MSYKTFNGLGEEEAEKVLHEPQGEEKLALLSGKVCGNCKHFSLREGQRLIEAQRFVETLVKEHQWSVRHLGSPPEILGDCGAARSGSKGDDAMVTGPMHIACDQFRRKGG